MGHCSDFQTHHIHNPDLIFYREHFHLIYSPVLNTFDQYPSTEITNFDRNVVQYFPFKKHTLRILLCSVFFTVQCNCVA